MSRIEITEADITSQSVDAIVNAANSDLNHAGGVALAIARAAGPTLTDQSAVAEFVPTGECVATTAGDLDARYVIHAVGPIWRGGDEDEERLLSSAYRNSIELAASLKCVTVALPSISTGVFGYPVELAAPVALRSVSETLATSSTIKCVRFCLFTMADIDAFLNSAEATGIAATHVVTE